MGKEENVGEGKYILWRKRKTEKEEEEIIWRTKINVDAKRRQPGEYSAICLFEG